MSFKPYACGRPLHALLDAAIAVREELQPITSVDLAEIAAASVTGPAAILDEEFRGATDRSRPAQIVEVHFALPHLILVAIVRGRVGITETADIHHDLVLDLTARIDGIATGQKTRGITIWPSEGRGATTRVEPPLGSSEYRLSAEQLAINFADCARHAVRPLPDGAAPTAIQMIRHLEEVPNINDLLRQFI